jgi:hypothetical protein
MPELICIKLENVNVILRSTLMAELCKSVCKEQGKEEWWSICSRREKTAVATLPDKDGLTFFTVISLLRRSLAKLGVLVVVL